MSEGVIGSLEHKPFAVYSRGERWPLESVIGVVDGPVLYGCLRWAPVDIEGNVTLSAEALRDLCNHAYREGWRFGNAAPKEPAP